MTLNYFKRLLPRLVLFSVVFSCSAVEAVAAPQPNSAKRHLGVSGTFIQYQSWMLQLDAPRWQAELDAMARTGIETIVIQWLKSEQTRFFPVHAPGNDPTEMILTYADAHGMQVHLGGLFEKEWWTQWDDQEFLRNTAKKNEVFAAQVYRRYGKHKSFAGWYIPYEMGDIDFDAEDNKALNVFLKQYTSGLRKTTHNKIPISISVFFQGQTTPATWVERNYSQILNQSGVDLILVQDGVGAHNWNVSEGSLAPSRKQGKNKPNLKDRSIHLPVREKLVAFFNAYQNAARKNHIRVWGVLETFSTARDKDVASGGPARVPAEISRIKQQLQFHALQKMERTFSFDFFHYMSPLRGGAQKKLYEEYLEALPSFEANWAKGSWVLEGGVPPREGEPKTPDLGLQRGLHPTEQPAVQDPNPQSVPAVTMPET